MNIKFGRVVAKKPEWDGKGSYITLKVDGKAQTFKQFGE